MAWLDYRRCGVAPLDLPPAKTPARVVDPPGGQIKMWKLDHKFVFQLQSEVYPVYLLSPPSARAGNSATFSEHLSCERYRAERYGLRCSPDDIALYDFATNQLLATWVSGFTDEAGALGGLGKGLIFEISGSGSAAAEELVFEGCRLVH